LRALLPTLTLLAMLPSVSTSPHACADALPSAHLMRKAGNPSMAPAPAAAPKTPQVEVMCHPRR
jgi:hypothetical protein